MENFIWRSSSFCKQGSQAYVRGPGESGAAEHRHGHQRGLAASPSGGLAKEDHGEIKTPGDEGERDARIANPSCTRVDERPGAARDNAERDDTEPGAHGVGGG